MRAGLCLALASVLTLTPPMWLGSDPGIVLAQPSGALVLEEPLGVTKGTLLVQGSPLRAMKRFGDKQRSLLNRAARAGSKGRQSGRARGVRPNRVRAANRTSAVSGGVSRSRASGGTAGDTYGEVTLQGLGNHEYLRLAGRLSGQRCESVEGGVIVRRGC